MKELNQWMYTFIPLAHRSRRWCWPFWISLPCWLNIHIQDTSTIQLRLVPCSLPLSTILVTSLAFVSVPSFTVCPLSPLTPPSLLWLLLHASNSSLTLLLVHLSFNYSLSPLTPPSSICQSSSPTLPLILPYLTLLNTWHTIKSHV